VENKQNQTVYACKDISLIKEGSPHGFQTAEVRTRKEKVTEFLRGAELGVICATKGETWVQVENEEFGKFWVHLHHRDAGAKYNQGLKRGQTVPVQEQLEAAKKEVERLQTLKEEEEAALEELLEKEEAGEGEELSA